MSETTAEDNTVMASVVGYIPSPGGSFGLHIDLGLYFVKAA